MRAALFDFGGTVDTNGVHWSEKFWEVYQRFGVPLDKSRYERAYVAAEQKMGGGAIAPGDGLLATLTAQVLFQFAEARQGDSGNHDLPDTLARRIAESCRDDVLATIDRVRPVLIACSRAFPLALVSNFYGNLESVCAELALRSCFTVIADSAVLGMRKPAREIFSWTLGQLGVPAPEAAVIGDSYDNDIVPGKMLGCTTVWLRGRSWKEEKDFSMADHIIGSLEELGRLWHRETGIIAH